ncbi:MAG: hypothetical protein Q8755_02535 [Candidatus Phytoplasma australasiaticum]|nr:hypothetical protein [Candidatus Phytoplasma australasiaticum]
MATSEQNVQATVATEVPEVAETKKPRGKPTKDRKTDPRHNMVAHLNLTRSSPQEFSGVVTFLRRSRVFYAINRSCTVYKSLQQEFWESASVESKVIAERRDRPHITEEFITSKIQNVDIEVSEGTLRRILQLGVAPD